MFRKEQRGLRLRFVVIAVAFAYRAVECAGLCVMYKMFICVSDDKGLRTQRYAASAANELEVREAMLRYLGKDFVIKSVRKASDDEIRRHGSLPAGTITLLPFSTE